MNTKDAKKDNKMTEANKNKDLTANSMKLNAKLSFTVSIPKKGWCGSVQPCSEQCTLYKFVKARDFKTDEVSVSLAEQKDSVNVTVTPDFDCKMNKGWDYLYNINTHSARARNFILDIRRCCSQCRKNQGR